MTSYKSMSFSEIAIVPEKENSYRIDFWSISKDKARKIIQKL